MRRRTMTDYELDYFCQHNPDCGYDCYHCPAFQLNREYNLNH